MTEPMQPLERSWSANDEERELGELFIRLYKEQLQTAADEINFYGMPHLGPFSLIERSLTSDGLSVLRDTDEDSLRFLYRAWKHRNPERGLHFLRTYLRAIWGDNQMAYQLWQKKTEPYADALALKSMDEIVSEGLNPADFYLTSRIRADIDTDIVPDLLIRSLQTTVAARLLLQVRIAKFQRTTMLVGHTLGAAQFSFGIGTADASLRDPVMVSSTTSTSGTTITAVFSEVLSSPSGHPELGWTISTESGARAISAAVIDYNELIFTVSPPVYFGETVTIAYNEAVGDIVEIAP